MYNKEQVKENLELEDIFDLLDTLDAEPQMYGNCIISKTICHNGDSHKLYYYPEQKLFHCYTGDCGSFDIFELLNKVDGLDLNQAVNYVVHFFNLEWKVGQVDDDFNLEDYKIIKKKKEILGLQPRVKGEVQLEEYDSHFMLNYPRPHILNWEREHINKEVCDNMGICYDPIGGNVLIPHYDINDRLIGIRQRTLIKDNEQYGKYRPFRRGKQLYNHPLAFNLYGINRAKKAIKEFKTAIVVESEKSVLQYISYFGIKSDIAVGVCGQSFSQYQFDLLRSLGVKEIVIGFDKDWIEKGGKDWQRCAANLEKLNNKYGQNNVMFSFLWDKDGNLLDYKNSPTDKGREIFLTLFRNRIII